MSDELREAIIAGLADAYDRGFGNSCQGYNGEHPGDAESTDGYKSLRRSFVTAILDGREIDTLLTKGAEVRSAAHEALKTLAYSLDIRVPK